MISGSLRYLTVSALIVSLLTFCACSKENEAQKEGKQTTAATQQITEAIQNFAKKPIDKARAVQRLGDEHTRAIDETVGDLIQSK